MERKRPISIDILDISPSPDSYSLMPIDDESDLQKLVVEGLLNARGKNRFANFTPGEQENLIQTTSVLGSVMIGRTNNLWHSYLWNDIWEELNIDFPEYFAAIPDVWQTLVKNGLHNFFDMKQTRSNSMGEVWQKRHMAKKGSCGLDNGNGARYGRQYPASKPYHS